MRIYTYVRLIRIQIKCFQEVTKTGESISIRIIGITYGLNPVRTVSGSVLQSTIRSPNYAPAP